jgi:hypothetical protein
MADFTTNEGTKQAESLFVTIAEAAQIIGCSYSSAQKAVAYCNKRAKTLGLFTVAGKCNRRALMEYLGADRASFFDGPGRVK